eukprot:TRINITY_DN3583_c0_g1_i1.p2 TRINITY_DN3583_c0_g1~~TRINITY_DN3583_c0_g1_i1.p2  ORF type:complete len:114 (-),score=1.75 TRINITY_DN3583_c0_g1_i1:8-349(-)
MRAAISTGTNDLIEGEVGLENATELPWKCKRTKVRKSCIRYRGDCCPQQKHKGSSQNQTRVLCHLRGVCSCFGLVGIQARKGLKALLLFKNAWRLPSYNSSLHLWLVAVRRFF